MDPCAVLNTVLLEDAAEVAASSVLQVDNR